MSFVRSLIVKMKAEAKKILMEELSQSLRESAFSIEETERGFRVYVAKCPPHIVIPSYVLHWPIEVKTQ